MFRRTASLNSVLVAALLLSACGGGGTNNTSVAQAPTQPTTPSTPTLTPTPDPAPVGECSLRNRQLWAEANIREWYLFPDDLPANLDPTPFGSVQAYIDGLTATARAANKDRFFTYATSIAEENAFFNSGQTAAFGVRLVIDSASGRLFLLDVFETGPAAAAGMERGAEIIAIGESPDNLVSVTTLFAQGGSNAISNALGPSQAGLSRTFRYRLNGAESTVTISRTQFSLPPVSPRFGVQTFDEPGLGRVGYVNLRSFISTAETPLREAFARFRNEGVRNVIIDLRYNGGGLVRIAELMGDLMGQGRRSSDVFNTLTYRPSKSANNVTRLFRQTPEAIDPVNVAFIMTGSSASASELVLNGMLPYYSGRLTMVGSNSFGKPTGQIAVDRAACDDRLRILAFESQNANRDGSYYSGLASYLPSRGGRTCAANDDFLRPMGNREEASTARAIAALRGDSCTPIGAATTGARLPSMRPTPLLATQPSAAQREMPGLF